MVIQYTLHSIQYILHGGSFFIAPCTFLGSDCLEYSRHSPRGTPARFSKKPPHLAKNEISEIFIRIRFLSDFFIGPKLSDFLTDIFIIRLFIGPKLSDFLSDETFYRTNIIRFLWTIDPNPIIYPIWIIRFPGGQSETPVERSLLNERLTVIDRTESKR